MRIRPGSLFIILFTVAFLGIAAIEVSKECDSLFLKSELKKELKPDYKYDSSKITRFTYGSKVKAKEIEVPLFMGEKYRFLFNTAGLPTGIDIRIYDKKSTSKKRSMLYQLEQKEDQHIYAFEPEKSRKMYINYIIPETSELDLKGCVVFLVGYKVSLFKKKK